MECWLLGNSYIEESVEIWRLRVSFLLASEEPKERVVLLLYCNVLFVGGLCIVLVALLEETSVRDASNVGLRSIS